MMIRAGYIEPTEVLYQDQVEGEDPDTDVLHNKLEENLTDRMNKAS